MTFTPEMAVVLLTANLPSPSYGEVSKRSKGRLRERKFKSPSGMNLPIQEQNPEVSATHPHGEINTEPKSLHEEACPYNRWGKIACLF